MRLSRCRGCLRRFLCFCLCVERVPSCSANRQGGLTQKVPAPGTCIFTHDCYSTLRGGSEVQASRAEWVKFRPLEGNGRTASRLFQERSRSGSSGPDIIGTSAA